MHVLIGVNGTEISAAAARFVSRILVPERDRITLYTSPPRIRAEAKSPLVPQLSGDLQAAFAASVFAHVQKELPEAFHRSTETLQGQAAPDEGLLEAAERVHADLIVVGADSHPRRFMIYLGGVAHRVAHQSRVPVLVFRPNLQPADDEGLRVLLADDGSPAARRAGDILKTLAWPRHSEGWLIRVVEWLDFGGVAPDVLAGGMDLTWRTEYDRHLAEVRAHIFEDLRARQKELPPIFHGLVPLICDGHRIQEICDTVDREHIDLLVVGSRNLTAVQRVLGSTSEGLLRHAGCSVLVVHEAKTL